MTETVHFQSVWTVNGESLLLIEVDNGHRLYIIRMVNNLELIEWFGEAN